MRIVCPSCGAAYEVPAERLAPGRMVGCAKCGTRWAPLAEVAPVGQETEKPRLEERVVPPEPVLSPPPPEPAPEPPVLVAPSRQQGLVIPEPEPKRRLTPLAAAWVLSVVLLALAAWAAVDRREAIMRVWPASERAYAALGMGPPK